MPLHAIDDIGDAIDATKSLLFPFAARTWLKLAVVVFFISGGGGGLNSLQSPGNFGGGQDQPAPPGVDQPIPGGQQPTPDALPGAIGPELLAVFALVALLVLFFGVLSNFMEFVFVQSLISREVHVRQYFRENIGNGLRLLGFRLVVAAVSLAVALLFLWGLFVTAFGGSFDNITVPAVFGVLPIVLVFFVAFALVQGLVTGFTNVFVVPLMLTADTGVVGGWKRLLGSMGRHPKQYVAYVFFSVVLGIGVGIIGGIVGFLSALLLGIPFVFVAGGAFALLGGGTVALAIIAVSVLLFALVLLVVTNLVKVPLQAFLRYYAMLVFGDVEASLDPIPAVRADIRPPAGEDAATESGGV